jgi:hypothetical protein
VREAILVSSWAHRIQIGDAFVICDAGGGTVDLISYEITKLVPLELKELVPGKGPQSISLESPETDHLLKGVSPDL